MFDLIIRDGDVVTPWGVLRADLGLRDGMIAELGSLSDASAAQVLDAASLVVLPGVIDSQVHFREPGLEHKEDLESGTRAALVGGVTTVLEMPNTRPPTTTAARLEEKIVRARDRVWTDVGFFVGASCSNIDELAELERAPHCAGVKVFHGSSTGDLLVETEADLDRVLRAGVRRVAIHAEDEARLRERRPIAERGSVSLHPEWRDVESAARATERCIRLARLARRPIHVLHVTTAEELELLAQARDVATVEVTPQHLTFTSPDCYARLGSRAQMNPPIREARHREALWRAIEDGLVDVVGSDHAPHTLEEKAKPYPESPSGMPGVEMLLPIMLDHVQKGLLRLERMVDLLCHGPARVYGIPRKGRIARGMIADLTVVDPRATTRVSDSDVRSKCGWTPYDGMVLQGRVHATVLRGALAMREGEVLGRPAGQPVELGPIPPHARHGGLS
jgi:dihydroorotase